MRGLCRQVCRCVSRPEPHTTLGPARHAPARLPSSARTATLQPKPDSGTADQPPSARPLQTDLDVAEVLTGHGLIHVPEGFADHHIVLALMRYPITVAKIGAPRDERLPGLGENRFPHIVVDRKS